MSFKHFFSRGQRIRSLLEGLGLVGETQLKEDLEERFPISHCINNRNSEHREQNSKLRVILNGTIMHSFIVYVVGKCKGFRMENEDDTQDINCEIRELKDLTHEPRFTVTMNQSNLTSKNS